MEQPFYVTTPIYYVNDRPHVGHCYSTLVADCVARFMRLAGRDVFFLTGTDEHAEKVVESAQAHNVTPQQWSDRNAAAFQDAFGFINASNDDFIRTTEPRHKSKVEAYVRKLLASGDIKLGDYEGWWDASQEEYVTDNTAKEHDYKSPVTGKPLVKRTEQNYFFDLPKYEGWLLEHIKANPGFIRPEARKNEILGRIREGLQRVPISRAVKADDPRSQWGILMPGDPNHRIYVWIDALFNYLSTVDTPERKKWWPANVHVMAKDIVWFHAVIWPCLLKALGEGVPECVYAHSFWVREGRKMSKSLGNFIDLDTIKAYCAPAPAGFGVDAFRWYMLTQGPLGATDADFTHAKFAEVYNADLANGIGNAASRVANMIEKYFGGKCPEPGETGFDLESDISSAVLAFRNAIGEMGPGSDWDSALGLALGCSRRVDVVINASEPFKLAKDPANMPKVGAILYQSAEAIRIAAVLLSPAMPATMGELLKRLGQEAPDTKGRFSKPLAELCKWGGLKPGTPIVKGDALFPRWDVKNPAPTAVAP